MKQLEIGDRCEVYRVEANTFYYDGFKIGTFRVGKKEDAIGHMVSTLNDNGLNLSMSDNERSIFGKEVTHVATMVIKQLKNIG